MNTLEQLEQSVACPLEFREKPEGVRVLAPTGKLGYVPEENVEAAVNAGAKVMDGDAMRELRQNIFMTHLSFQEKNKPVEKRKRRSIVRSKR